jgi:hypothetical protein
MFSSILEKIKSNCLIIIYNPKVNECQLGKRGMRRVKADRNTKLPSFWCPSSEGSLKNAYD